MNSKQRESYWLKTERLRRQIEAKYFEKLKDSIYKNFVRFANDLTKYGVSGARSRLGLDVWDKEITRLFEQMYKETVVTFGNATYRVLKIEANRKADTFGFNSEWTNSVLDFLFQQGFTLVADITSTTKKKMNDIVTKGINEGLSIEEIVRIMKSDEQLSYSAFRARRIARTEVMRASNIGAMKGAEAHDFEVDKQWIAARDSRTRRIPEDTYDHVALDGVVVGFDEPFESMGKEGQQVSAMQPGDINAPPGFTINCRCAVGFIPKRDKNGRLILKPKTNGVNVGRINTQNVINQQIVENKPETKQDIEKSIYNIFNNNSNLKVKKVNLSNNLTIEQLKERRNTLETLTNQYKISPAIDKNYESVVSFNSTNKSYGYIRSTANGKLILEANFGDSSDSFKNRDFNKDFQGIRFKSRVDEKNLDIATTVHEYGHLISLRHQLKQFNPPTEIVNYYKELKKINSLYKKELKGFDQTQDYYNRNQISLGDYASTNIDEFMAEAFTEYRLSSNPSKYATLVGKLIDKYFKK
jgi:uncharacterized protein with gpF-like domain